ncbi:Uma2 family endonuclease [Polyangium sp. y55x31]|uniref:Uma2 family endonuclease n=1 Tax=Polyangium sp. y55x31 TaxID=3042688 RepID=UPI002482E40F|nr:Uma2 family endonuclease [Polyangium sp. y55x31]MDI1482778.1 Uma2 family endonuclease [Polyangium sp. y55x31]
MADARATLGSIMGTAERVVPNQRMTFEEAARLDPDEQAGEIVDGEWVPMTRGTWRHGELVLSIGFLLRLYVREQPGWSVSVADPGVKLARNPDRLRGPDVAMVRKERVPTGKGVDGWLEGAPDIAVEVVSDSQSISEMTKKALEYIAGGSQMVWLVDPEPRRIVLFTPPNQVKILGPDDTLDGGDVLPGFSCQVADMFT